MHTSAKFHAISGKFLDLFNHDTLCKVIRLNYKKCTKMRTFQYITRLSNAHCIYFIAGMFNKRTEFYNCLDQTGNKSFFDKHFEKHFMKVYCVCNKIC